MSFQILGKAIAGFSGKMRNHTTPKGHTMTKIDMWRDGSTWYWELQRQSGGAWWRMDSGSAASRKQALAAARQAELGVLA